MTISFPFFLFFSASVVNFGLFALFVSTLVLIISKKIKITLNVPEIFVYIVFAIYMFIGWLYLNGNGWLYFVTTIYFIYSILIARVLLCYEDFVIVNAVKKFILFYMFCIVIQYLIFFASGKYFDIHNIITLGEYSSRIESNTMASLGVIRPTGLAIEPSNASATMAYLLFIYFLFKENKKNNIYYILFPIFTISFTALIVFIITYIIYAVWAYKSNLLVFLFILIFCCVVFFFGYELLLYRFSFADYDAVSLRSSILYVINDLDMYHLLLGNGVYMSENPIEMGEYTLYHSSIRDAGLIFNLIFTFGIIPTVAFYMLILVKIYRVSRFSMLLFLSLSFLKFDYMQPLFWFVIAIVLSYNPNKKELIDVK